MKRSKGEGSCKTLDIAIKKGTLTRQDFLEICGDLEQQLSSSNKKFSELYDLILKQKPKKEFEYKKQVGFHI